MKNQHKPKHCSLTMLFLLSILLPRAYAADNNSLPVATMQLRPQLHYTQTRNFVGRVEANRVSNLGFELNGVLSEIHKDEGDTVKRGEVVAELDTQKLRARREEALAGMAQAQAALRLAQASLIQVQRVANQKLIANQTLDEAREARDSAEALLAQAKAIFQTIEVAVHTRCLCPVLSAWTKPRGTGC